MSHKNAALAFDKLNSYLQDFQEWMLSSMLKLNPDKKEFIIFGSHDQLKIPTSQLGYLIISCIQQLLLRTLVSSLMLISPFLIMSAIFVGHASFKCMISCEIDRI